MARILERFPTAFDEMAMLGIQDRCFARTEPEKPRIEHFHVRQRHGRADIARILNCR